MRETAEQVSVVQESESVQSAHIAPPRPHAVAVSPVRQASPFQQPVQQLRDPAAPRH